MWSTGGSGVLVCVCVCDENKPDVSRYAMSTSVQVIMKTNM